MQAMKIKRFAVNRVGIAIVAIGTLATGLVGMTVLHDATRGSEHANVVVTRSVAPVDQTARMHYIEQNTQLPAAVAAPARSTGEMTFIEQNTMFPTGTSDVTHSAAEIAFLEMNTLLPQVSAEITSYFAPGAGEGWLAYGRPVEEVTSYFVTGAGEGWLAYGRPAVSPAQATGTEHLEANGLPITPVPRNETNN